MGSDGIESLQVAGHVFGRITPPRRCVARRREAASSGRSNRPLLQKIGRRKERKCCFGCITLIGAVLTSASSSSTAASSAACSRSGNVRDNAAIESLFLVAETERTERENALGKVDELA